MSEKIRQHIIFSARVQGVGFRWHASNFARLEGLTGWVRNLDDGTVEMEVQGSEIKIGKLIQYMFSLRIWILSPFRLKKVNGLFMNASYIPHGSRGLSSGKATSNPQLCSMLSSLSSFFPSM